jgi:hypothetical protein
VVLITFKPTSRTGRSAALVREVDEVIVLDPGFWKPHFAKRKKAPVTATPPDSGTLAEAASSFASDWASGATGEEVLELLDKDPWMPRDLYVQLLLAAEASTGSLREHPEAKGELRREFFKALRAESGKDMAEPSEPQEGPSESQDPGTA